MESASRSLRRGESPSTFAGGASRTGGGQRKNAQRQMTGVQTIAACTAGMLPTRDGAGRFLCCDATLVPPLTQADQQIRLVPYEPRTDATAHVTRSCAEEGPNACVSGKPSSGRRRRAPHRTA